MGPVVDAPAGRAVVVGSGIAGLTVALELGDCTVVTGGELGDGASRWAQGGIAAALDVDDAPSLHAADTNAVAAELADRRVVELVAEGAPERIAWLERLGARFDRDADGGLLLGREAGHRRDRIVHADGDATGAAVMRALAGAVTARDDIEVVAGSRAVDLIRAGDRVVGVLIDGPEGRRPLLADAVVLATGGLGRAYARTTNPASATGDGVAMAARAGARLRDLEFVQFHPTALDTSLDPLPLLTEALRGAGATLIDAAGRRYLVDEHPDAELAPRDVVARGNWAARERGPIYLDARVVGEVFPERFPTVFAHAQAAGLDPRVDPLPVTPAQHYHMGGIATDDAGHTSLPGLFACGEVAATGLHGANRLASNSLLEGLVLGARVAAAIAVTVPSLRPLSVGELEVADVPQPGLHDPRTGGPGTGGPGTDHLAAIEALRSTMWRAGGLVRTGDGLRSALRAVEELRPVLASGPTGRNLEVVATLVLEAALSRRESRGGHWRADHPGPRSGRRAAASTFVTPRPTGRRRLQAAATEPATEPATV